MTTLAQPIRAQSSPAGLAASHRSAAITHAAPEPDPAPATAPAFGRNCGTDFVQVPTFRISSPGDAAEREADWAAEQVMRGERASIAAAPSAPLARKCETCEDEEERQQRAELRRKAEGASEPADRASSAVAEALAAPGQPLEPAIRAAFEPRFGASFADVRVHADPAADRAARAVGARAFTLGRRIGFATGQYAPGTPAGQRLLAHELAHAVQQSAPNPRGIVHRYPYSRDWVSLPRGNIVTTAGASYWLRRIDERYSFRSHSPRAINDQEELDAVLAALLAANPPTRVLQPTERIVTIPAGPATGTGRAPRPALIYRFRFRPGTDKPELTAEFVRVATRGDPAPPSIPADYGSRGYWDFELEALRNASRAPADRLGTVTLPPNLPADERLAIQYAIVGYFDTGRARNTEVDAVIPVGAAARSLMVTLRFGTNNDVVVERIGEVGTGAGQVDVNRIDVTRVNGFPGATATDAALRAWWTRRYPAGGALATASPPAGPAPAAAQPSAAAPPSNSALIAEMNRLMAAGSGTPAWFRGNYGLRVMDARETRRRLTRLDPGRASIVADTRDFTAAELASLEVALQLLGEAELRHLRGVRLGRKSTGAQLDNGRWEAANVSGLAIQGTDRIILYFDSMTNADPWHFRGGGASTALSASTQTIVHEFGHVIGNRAAIQTAFLAWERQHPQVTPTDYAATNPSERFAEFYALYRTDPRFLCGSAPPAFAWFAELARTGRPPRANASPAAPVRCPQ